MSANPTCQLHQTFDPYNLQHLIRLKYHWRPKSGKEFVVVFPSLEKVHPQLAVIIVGDCELRCVIAQLKALVPETKSGNQKHHA